MKEKSQPKHSDPMDLLKLGAGTFESSNYPPKKEESEQIDRTAKEIGRNLIRDGKSD